MSHNGTHLQPSPSPSPSAFNLSSKPPFSAPSTPETLPSVPSNFDQAVEDTAKYLTSRLVFFSKLGFGPLWFTKQVDFQDLLTLPNDKATTHIDSTKLTPAESEEALSKMIREGNELFDDYLSKQFVAATVLKSLETFMSALDEKVGVSGVQEIVDNTELQLINDARDALLPVCSEISSLLTDYKKLELPQSVKLWYASRLRNTQDKNLTAPGVKRGREKLVEILDKSLEEGVNQVMDLGFDQNTELSTAETDSAIE